MNLTLPRDFEAHNSFRRFVAIIGDEKEAIYIFIRLWIELGYQVDLHGGSGVFSKSEVDTFTATLRCATVPETAVECLVRSGLLAPAGEDSWICPMFSYRNPELDRSYVPESQRSMMVAQFIKRTKNLEKSAPSITTLIPAECWQGEDGNRITPAEMQRAIVLIKTIDGILRLSERSAEQFEAGIVNDARRVIQGYSSDKLTVILRRLYIVRHAKGFTRSTEFYLRNFETLVLKIMPDEGYVNWAKQKGYNE